MQRAQANTVYQTMLEGVTRMFTSWKRQFLYIELSPGEPHASSVSFSRFPRKNM